jgi:hypothetical protein
LFLSNSTIIVMKLEGLCQGSRSPIRKRKSVGYGTGIPAEDSSPLTLFIICSRSGLVCSISSSASSSSSLDDASLPDDSSSSTPEGKAGVIGALFCIGVDVLSCAKTELWLILIVATMTTDSSRTAVTVLNLRLWILINLFFNIAI